MTSGHCRQYHSANSESDCFRFGASAMLSSNLGKGAELKIDRGGPRVMCTTQKDEINGPFCCYSTFYEELYLRELTTRKVITTR